MIEFNEPFAGEVQEAYETWRSSSKDHAEVSLTQWIVMLLSKQVMSILATKRVVEAGVQEKGRQEEVIAS